MPRTKNVRIYDLAKELKQDTKRVIEELRREGADVSVPSNSVPKELADKIRNKYFPKVEKKLKRKIVVVKKKEIVKEPAVEISDNGSAATAPPIEVPEKQEISAKSPEKTETVSSQDEDKSKLKPQIVKLKKKAVEEAEVEPPVEVEEIPEQIEVPEQVKVSEKVEAVEESKQEKEAIAETVAVEAEKEDTKDAAAEDTGREVPKVTKLEKKEVLPASGTKVTKLTLTTDARNKGIKPGDRVVSTAPTKTGKLAEKKEKPKRGKRGGRKSELRGTPGETATPQRVYTPPKDNRPRGRGGRKGGKRFETARGKFDEREFNQPKPKSIEERILDQIDTVDKSNLKEVRLTEGATIREFANSLGITPRDIVQLLVKRGVFATLNQPIGETMAQEMGEVFGYNVSFIPFEDMVIEQEFEEIIAADSDDIELPRPPVITVMGHVDHGKTSLLDAIRSENVAEGEAGGITQHIGAYSVYVKNPDNEDEQRRVVFLDTPGHEAFTMMRARGAKATDIVILVVAADDGVMPQTAEAIEHSKAANVPMIVAINKIDKPDANADKVKQELATQGLQPVDWGGDVEMIPVSAIKHQNLDTLLETVLLTSDILNLKASPTRRASGVVLEAKLDKGRGSVATVLVQQGTLRVGDPFIVGQYNGKVRAMFNDLGEQIDEAPPATPVEVLGLQGVPQAGDIFQAVSDIDKAVTIANQRQQQARQVAMLKTTKRGIESLGQAEIKELLVVLKADVQGSVEVLRATLEKLSTEKVKVRVIRSGVGAITESDVLLASATQADEDSTAVVIIGFNVRPGARANDIAKQEEVDIRLHSIIYKVEEEIRAAMIGMLDKIEKENILGKAVVQDLFKVSKVGTIAGCRVTDGVIRRQAKARLIRDGVVIWDGDIASLKRFKEDANEVKNGYECGISLVNYNDLKVGDEIEAYIIEQYAPTELS